MLFEYVITEFDELGIHPVNDPMCRARYCTHDLVDQLWVRINDGLERCPGQRQYVRLTKRPETHRVRRTIDETQLTGKLAVITGGASGVGRSLALALGRRGAKIAIGDVDGNAMEQVGRELEVLH